MDLDKKEALLNERLERLDALEQEIKNRESVLKAKESAKKQVLLRLSPTLWNKIAQWADEDFRSINGQIEFILAKAVKEHFGSKDSD